MMMWHEVREKKTSLDVNTVLKEPQWHSFLIFQLKDLELFKLVFVVVGRPMTCITQP